MEHFIKDLYKMDKNLEKVLLKRQMVFIIKGILNTINLMVLDRFAMLISQLMLGNLKMGFKMERVI
jgi:hypothetical protein